MAVAFIVQGPLKHDSMDGKTIFGLILGGLFGGATAGLLFGWLIGVFMNSKFVKQGTQIKLEEDETVLFETGANHFMWLEAGGGRLYLTNKWLVFRSHKLNIQKHELSFPLKDIEKVNRYKTLGIANNGSAVTTVENKVEKIAVEQPADWIRNLEKTINAKGL